LKKTRCWFDIGFFLVGFSLSGKNRWWFDIGFFWSLVALYLEKTDNEPLRGAI
jgi:hypothetical protein